jgi:hypothetical protein
VLGPGPPPWENDEIYRFLSIFNDFGVFNRAGKTVSKIGIYALPPLKREIYGDFINSLPNFSCGTVFIKNIIFMPLGLIVRDSIYNLYPLSF